MMKHLRHNSFALVKNQPIDMDKSTAYTNITWKNVDGTFTSLTLLLPSYMINVSLGSGGV